MKTSRALKPLKSLREGLSHTHGGFARAPPFGNDSSDNDKPPPNLSRETQFSGANADREIFIFPVQLTTSRIGNLTWLILTLSKCVTIQLYILARCEGGEVTAIKTLRSYEREI